MSRLLPYFAIVAFVLFSFLIVLSVDTREHQTPITIVPNTPTVITTSTRSTSTASIATPERSKQITKLKSAPAPTATLPVSPAPSPVTQAPMSVSDPVATTLRDALINILCYAPAGSALHSISGSGVFIDQKGIIITNAHVAQQFLLADRGVDCTIRIGSPAVDRYKASLIYISPAWLRSNSKVLTETLPNGTGEYDFAFLAVTKSAEGAPMGGSDRPVPATFPFISLATLPSVSGTPVVIASYGAQFIASSQIQSALFPTVVFGSVKDIFTFGTNTIDVIALGGSAAAQEGSSGGGVADASGNLVGMITTSTVTGATDTRSLDAITASYIRAQYANETGSALDLLLSRDTATSVNIFATKLNDLEAIITAGLP